MKSVVDPDVKLMRDWLEPLVKRRLRTKKQLAIAQHEHLLAATGLATMHMLAGREPSKREVTEIYALARVKVRNLRRRKKRAAR